MQDNFRYVQEDVKALYAKQPPQLLLKLDLAKELNHISWVFFLNVLQHMGFLRAFGFWILVLLSIASTKVLINGAPGCRSACSCHLVGGSATIKPQFYVDDVVVSLTPYSGLATNFAKCQLYPILILCLEQVIKLD